ncbi:MAG: VacJ family lipoprotein [Deltaproteobacteria bacterium]|nr:MAG: VacJ family lipoprotein [Deltaproteobacteria bacterium]TMA96062.1 MAG: VacJ family lipoprotein [Deltaproteobacteria bacterium]
MRSRGTRALGVTFAGLLYALPVAAGDAAPGAPTDVEAAPAEEVVDETPDYDPWQPFNERTFAFNYRVLDRFVMKPLGKAWDWVLPDRVQRSLDNAFANLEMPRRFVNHLLQARPRAAGAEVGRFLVNTTVGVVGFIDVAERLGLHGRDADTGQTLGVWGIGSGPYLVLPFLPPLTVRDGIGQAVDSALDPVGYLFPVPLAVSLSMTGVRRVNGRSLQPAAFENVEETVIDLYSSVRNAYLQRRRGAVLEGRADSAASCRRPRSVAPLTSSP